MTMRTDIIAERMANNITSASKGTLDSRRPGSGYYRSLLGGKLSEVLKEEKRRRRELGNDLKKAAESTGVKAGVTLDETRIFGFSSGPGIEIYFIMDGIDEHDASWAVLTAMKKMGYRIK